MKTLLLALLLTATPAYSQYIDKAFEVDTSGFMMSLEGTDLISISSGTAAPTFQAPMGSVYFQSNGDEYKKTGALATDWVLRGLGSAVVTQTADFGYAGNAGAFLNRAGNVPSNISGVPIMISSGEIRTVSVSNEDVDTYSVAIYEHDGDFTNPTLLYTVSVVGARGKTDANLSIMVTQGKQLAAEVSVGAVKNVGATVAMKGLSL